MSGRKVTILDEMTILEKLGDAVEYWWTGADCASWISQRMGDLLTEQVNEYSGKYVDPLDETLKRPTINCQHPKGVTIGLCVLCVRCGDTMVNLKAEQQWEREGKR